MNHYEGYRITSPYGERISPINNEPEKHTGIDLAKSDKSDIHAFVEGLVVHASFAEKGSGVGGFGNHRRHRGPRLCLRVHAAGPRARGAGHRCAGERTRRSGGRAGRLVAGLDRALPAVGHGGSAGNGAGRHRNGGLGRGGEGRGTPAVALAWWRAAAGQGLRQFRPRWH